MSFLRMEASMASPHSQSLPPSPQRVSKNSIAPLRRGGQGARLFMPFKVASDRFQEGISLEKNPFLYSTQEGVQKPWSGSAEHVELSFIICRTRE
jgi:hypothetical protein